MGTKRGRIDLDPDYEDVSEQQSKRQRVLEQDAKEATRMKIESIIHKEFAGEIQKKEKEIDMIDQRIYKTRQMMDRLRACIVANFYSSAGEARPFQPSSSSSQPPAIHPTVKEHLGKAPKNIPATISKAPASETSRVPEADSSSCIQNHSITTPQKIEVEKGYITTPQRVEQIVPESKEDISTDEQMNQLTNRGSRFKIKKTIIVGNVSKYIPVDRREENDQSTHKWMMYVRGPKDSPRIDHFVKKVWFLLHPSYRPNDLVEVSQPPFHLTRRGWGEFPVRVQLHFKDQRNKRQDIIHLLKLDKTYTGLQTIGAETVVEVELEKEIIPDKSKISCVAKEMRKNVKCYVGSAEEKLLTTDSIVSNTDVTQDIVENNFTIKEHISPQKSVTPNKQDRRVSQREKTLSELKVFPGTSGVPMSNKENCYNNSAAVFAGEVTQDSLMPEIRKLKNVQECSSSSLLPTVLSKSATEGYQTVKEIVESSQGEVTLPKSKSIGSFIVKQSDSGKTVLNKQLLESQLQSSGLTHNSVATVSLALVPGSSAVTSSRTNSPLLGSSAVQVVLGGFGSITSSGISKPNEDEPQKSHQQQVSAQQAAIPLLSGKSLLKNMYNKSKKNVVTSASTLKNGSESATSSNLAGQASSSVVLQGLGSLSGTAMLGGNLKGGSTSGAGGTAGSPLVTGSAGLSKSPAFHIVTTNRNEALALQNQTNASVSKQEGNAKISNSMAETTSLQTLYVRCKDNQGNIFLVPHHLLKQVATPTTPQKTGSSSAKNSARVTTLITSPQKPSVTSVTPQQLSVRVTPSSQQTTVSSVTQNPSTSGKLSTPNSVVLSCSPVKVENNQKVNLVGKISATTTQSNQTAATSPSLFIKIEPQSQTSGSGGGKSQNMLTLKQGSPQAQPVPTLKKPSTVLHVKTESLDHEYFMKNSQDTVTNVAPPCKPQVCVSASESITTVAESTSDFVNAGSLVTKETNSASENASLQTSASQVQTKITLTGQLRVTPQGLKVVSTEDMSEVKGHDTSSVGVDNIQGDSNFKGSNGSGLIPKSSSTSVIFSGGDKYDIATSKMVTLPSDDVKTAPRNLLGKETSSFDSRKSVSLLNIGQNSSDSKLSLSSAMPNVTFSSSGVVMNSLLEPKSLSSNLQVKNKTMLATIGAQKLLIQVPGQEVRYSSKVIDIDQGSKVTQQNKYVINDEAFDPTSEWRNRDKKILNWKKKKCYETAPVKPKEIEPVRVADFPDMLSLVRAAVKQHPIVSMVTDLSQHPYCARSYEQWLSWNIGRRRASEWQRASCARKFIKKCLGNEESYKGAQLWTTKQIMVWCRLHAYSPHYMETTLHPTPVELSADSSMMGKNYSSATDSQKILPWLQDLTILDRLDGDSDDDLDIISIEPPKVKMKTEIKTEPVCSDDSMTIVPSSQAQFVQDLTQKIGIKFQPCEVDEEVYGSVSEDMIFQVMKSFVGDIIRDSFANKVNMGRYADGIGVGDVYKTLGKFPAADFITNAHLGVQPPDSEADAYR